jgi:hypothetical protein
VIDAMVGATLDGLGGLCGLLAIVTLVGAAYVEDWLP